MERIVIPTGNKLPDKYVVPEEPGLVDVTPELVLGGLGGKFDAAAEGLAGLANKIPSRFFDTQTYSGMLRGLFSKKAPQEIDMSRGVVPKGLSNSEKVHAAQAQLNPNLGGFFNPDNYTYMAKGANSKAHELQHAKDYLAGKSYGASPGSLEDMLVNSSKANPATADRRRAMSRRLYYGNKGERKARGAGELTGLAANATEEVKKRALDEMVSREKRRGIHGIGNSINPYGMAVKRNIKESLVNPKDNLKRKAKGLAAFEVARANPLEGISTPEFWESTNTYNGDDEYYDPYEY